LHLKHDPDSHRKQAMLPAKQAACSAGSGILGVGLDFLEKNENRASRGVNWNLFN
jgi:hypothetical protein